MKRLLYLLLFIPLFYVFAAERQVVISKIDIGLQNSKNYDFTNLSPTNTIKGLNGTALDLILDFNTTSMKNFTYNSITGKYEYPYDSKESYIMFPVTYNNSATVKTDSIKLIEEETTSTDDLITKVIIDETINLPASAITLVNSTTTSTGNLFKYTESTSIINEHFEKFKNQQYMIRISKGTTDYDYDPYNQLNKINFANANDVDFLTGVDNYIDFYFEGDDYTKLQKILTPTGIETTFIPGTIEIFGLPQGSYTITLYSFRYSTTYSDKGNVVFTRESKLAFTSKTVDISKNLIVKNVDVTSHPTIKGELMLISSAINPTYTMREKLGTGSFVNITPSTSTSTPIITPIYINSTTTITPDSSGYYDPDSNPVTTPNYYFYKVNFVYSSPNSAKNTTIRTIEFNSGSTTELISYYIAFNILPKITTYPYQTVISQWKTAVDFGTDSYEILDKIMSPTTYGYRGVKYISATTIKDAYLGNYSNTQVLTFDETNYQWVGSNGTQKTMMIQKVVQDTKGTYHKAGSSPLDIFSFYTLKNIQGFTYEQEGLTEIPENASFLWQDSSRSSYGVVVSDEELIFRITRLSSDTDTGLESKSYNVAGTSYTVQLPRYYLDVFANTNPIGTYNETTNIENFVTGSKTYLDLIFKKGEDRKIERANTIFTFFKDNKFEVLGLPRGNYMIQAYTVKGADLDTQKLGILDYKTITYETYKSFKIGLPELVYGNFASMNNLFLIESINVNSSFDINTNLPSKKVTVNFITKTSETINLGKANLTAQNMELTNGGPYKMPGYLLAEHHQDGSLMAVPDADINVFRADKAPFQFPLDIIFLIDDSGSMQAEINNVKNGLENFSNLLQARGYNVKFNLITFGPDQNARYSDIGNRYPVGSWMSSIYQYQDSGYLAIYKPTWFTDVNELIGAFDQIRAIGGYYDGQENGAQAIYNGANLLKNNGRYLDFNNNIVNHSAYQSGFIPSKKLLIFLTDENFDIENLNLVPGVTGSGNTARYSSYRTIISNLLNTENISLNGIYHIGNGNKDVLGNSGVTPADTGDRSYNEFITLLGSNFTRYEMGTTGQLTPIALVDTVKNTGIIQRWVLTYDSPFTLSDGFNREAIFSLTGVNGISGSSLPVLPYIRSATKDRFYFVPEDKLEAYFIKPDPVLKELIKKDGKVQLEVRARSQYRELQPDGTTKLVNYAIEKGSFKLNGSGNQLVLLSDKNEINIEASTNGWYSLKTSIDISLYYSLFEDNPIDIEATVATKYYGESINLTTVKLTEKDEPLITEIILENTTLKLLLESLKNTESQNTFISSEIEELTSIKITDSNGLSKVALDTIFSDISKRLNIKLNDTISYRITVFDESILKLNDSKVYMSGDLATIGKVDNVYTGNVIITNPNLTMRIDIYDDYGNFSSLMNSKVSSIITPFNIPSIITNTQFADDATPLESGNYYSSLNTGSSSANKALLVPNSTDSNAIAYLIGFNYDENQSDYGLYSSDGLVLSSITYPIIATPIYWAASKNGQFSLLDGKYDSTKVYILNKSGAIDGIASNNIDNIKTELATILTGSVDKSFFVDTVSPRIVDKYVFKISDLNGIPLTGKDLPFKLGDTISYRYEIEDFNYSNIILNPLDYIFRLSYNNETSSMDLTGKIHIINKNFNVIHNLVGVTENIDLSSTIYDLANNITSTSTRGIYNSKLPKQLRFVELILADMIKFTNDKDLILDEIGTGENIYYVEVTLGIKKGALVNTIPMRLNEFSMSAVENLYNIGTIATYSESGQAGTPLDDAIVVDTDINDNTLPSIVARKSSGNTYVATITFDTIKELVGLNGFKVLSSDGDIINGSLDGSGFYPLSNAGYFIVPTVSNITTEYTIQLPSSTIPSIDIMLKDRLDNTKVFNQEIHYIDVYTIIGKSKNSPKIIKTKIETGEKFDILSREGN